MNEAMGMKMKEQKEWKNIMSFNWTITLGMVFKTKKKKGCSSFFMNKMKFLHAQFFPCSQQVTCNDNCSRLHIFINHLNVLANINRV